MKIFKIQFIKYGVLNTLLVLAKDGNEALKAASDELDLPSSSDMVIEEVSTARPVKAKIFYRH